MAAAKLQKAAGLKEEISDFKRRRIREEASHLFFEHGYEGTTIDAIAARLDVTKPFIYSYYKNKSELLYDICRLGITLSLEAMDEACCGDKKPTERLRHLVERVLRIIIDYQEYIVVYEHEEKNLEKHQAREIRELRKLFDHRLAGILKEGHAGGEFNIKDPVLTATTIGGMLTWVSFWYSPSGKRTEHDIVSHVIDSIDAVVRRSAHSEPGAWPPRQLPE